MGKYTSLQKKERRDILQRAVLAMLTTGMVAWPSFSPVYAASNITDVSGNSVIDTANTVHDLYAQQRISSNVGMNKFRDFSVDTGNVANLHFRTSNTSTEHFNALMNFVDNRININGTVNAIRNNKIGGHLFFLSPGGMIVGASGAINTGSLTVIAPTQTGYNRIVSDLSGTNASEHANKLLTAEGVAAVPLNPSSSIVVQGKINAVNNVNLRAGQIYVGVNESGGSDSTTRAEIKTGVTDFRSIVNISGMPEENLIATRDANTGDINLVADVQLKNVSGSTATAKIVVDGGATIEAAKGATILAKVENNANAVEFKDNEGHTKYIVNGEITDTPPSSTGGFMSDRKNDLQAIVEIGKNSTEDKKVNITAQNDVKINALVENNFETGLLGGGDIVGLLTEIPSILLNVFTTGEDAVVGFLKSNAEVDIYKNSAINSAAGNIDILAQAKNKLVLGASVSAFNMIGATNNTVNSLPSLSVTVGSNKTDATVKVDGTITAEAGKVDITALGDNTFDTSAIIGAGYGGLNPNDAVIAAAVDVAWGHNNARVEIGSNANITARKDLSVLAATQNVVKSATSIKSTERNDASFVVDVLEYDSSAAVDVKGKLESEAGNLFVVAEDEFSTNSLTASSEIGATSLLAGLIGDKAREGSALFGFVERLMQNVAAKLPGEYAQKFANYGFADSGDPGEKNAFQQLMDKIKLGVSVGWMDENNRAVVNIAETAKLTAAEKVDLHAKVYHYGIETKVAGSVDVSSNRHDTAAGTLAAMVGGAVIIRDVDNTAEVIIDGRAEAAEDNIRGRNVEISAETKIESHNVQNKIIDFQNLFKIRLNETEFKNMFPDMDEDFLEALWKAYKNNMDLVGKEFFERDAGGNVVYGADGLPKVKADYIKGDNKTTDELYEKMQAALDEIAGTPDYKFLKNLMEGKEVTYRDKHGRERKVVLENKGFVSKVIDTGLGLYSAIDASNWVDFNVGSSVSHVYKGEGSNPKFAGNVMIAIDDVSNTANVLIGKNNRIKADNDMVIKTDTFLETYYVDGKLASAPFKGMVSKMTGSYGLNVMVGIRDLAQNSMIVAAENVQMSAKNLKVDADATAKVVGITEFIVSGAATSAVGSLALELPSFVNNNLISFDDEVKLDVTGGINLTGKNYLNEEIIAGGLVSSGKASGALIVQVFNQKRNNLVVVADNDDTAALISADEKVPELEWNDYTDSDPAKNKKKDTDEERVKKLIAANLLTDDSFIKKHPTEDKLIFDRDKAAGLFGTADVTKTNEIKAGSFYSNAKNEGEIVTAVADVALSITGGSLSEADDGPGFFAKLKDKMAPAGQFFMNYVAPTLGAPIYWPVVGAIKLGDFLSGKMNSWMPMANHGVPALEYPPDSEVPSVSLTAAGSVSVDTFRVRTASVVKNVNITITGTEVTKNNKTETVYNFSNIASDTTGMVNVAGSAAAGTKGYSKDFTAQYNDAFEHDNVLPAEDAEDATLVTLSGAAAVGMLVNDLNARVVGAKITDVKNFYNESIRDGHLATAAAAVAISLPKTFSNGFKKTTSAALAGGVSLNFGTYSTLASLKNNLVTGTDARPTDLFNIAQTQDIMVSGGIDVAFAKGSSTTVGMGAVVAYAAFGNDVTAEIKDDGTNDEDKLRKYTKIRNVENIARSSLTQATMAVGIGVAIQKGEQAHDATVALQGAAAVNNICNNVFAVTEGITLDAKNLQVLAYDFKRGDVTLPGEMAPEPIANDRMQEWEKSSITLFRDNKEAVKKEGQKNVENYYKGETKPVETLNEQGNLIITGGLELSLALAEGTGGSGSAGAALGLSIIDNNFVAEVKTSSITLTDAVKYAAKDASKVTSYPARVLAESNTEKWGMVAGANASRTNGSTSVTIGGSILLDFINNDVIAKVEKSNITTDGLCLDAYNKEKYVNATGYFGLATGGEDSGSVGVGLGIVYNKTLNNTAARLLNTDVSAYTPATGSVIGLFADSNTHIYAFAFGAGASNFGLTANVAVNVGQTNVEAVVEDDDTDEDGNRVYHVLDDVKSLTVQSKDDTYRMAIAGNVNVASTAALGAALTWNRIGHQLTADDEILKDFDKKDAAGSVVQTLVPSVLSNNGEATQTNRAKVSGYKVVTIDNAKVDISAIDKANFTTISIGAVLALPNVTSKAVNLSVEGANANSMIDKTTMAELLDSTVGKQSLDGGTTQDGSDNITVNVNASTDNKSLSSADVLSLSVGSGETQISFGAAVVENTIRANTKTNVSGTYSTKNMLVKAVSNQDLDNYAFGVAATQDFALGGNVVVNTISGETTANIGKDVIGVPSTTIYSSGSLGVIAESYEELTNGSGQLAASVGSETLSASGGVAVAVNSISGDTLANIVNADVVANGSAGAAAYAHKDSADMKRKLANKTLKKPEDYVAPTYTGLIVGADAFHHLNDVSACGSVGVSKTGGASLGVDATVAVDRINGSTKALVTGTNINQNQTSVGNVNVLATDALESYSKVINGGLSLSVEGKIGLSVGTGVLVNNNNRTVQSGIDGTGSCVLNAKDLHVLADSYADVDLLNIGVSLVFSGNSVAVAASVTSADVEEITDAYIKNMNGTADNITVESGHEDDFDFTGTNLAFAISTEYVGVGIGVQVNNITDKATVNALIDSSNFTHNNNNIYNDTVKAKNISDVDTFTFNSAVATGGAKTYGLGGAGVGVMVVNNDLKQITLAKVNNSHLADETNRAKNINVEATGSEHVDYKGANVTIGTGAAIGVATLLNDINTITRADVIDTELYAANDITVSADENKQLDNTLAQVEIGALGVGVPVIHNYIGMDVTSEYIFVETARENIDAKDEKKASKEAALDRISTDNYSFSAAKIQNLTQQGKEKFGAGNTPLMPNPYVGMAELGVVVNIDHSTLKAGNKLNILSKANTNSNSTLGGGSLAALNVMVPVNRQRIGENISVNIGTGSNLTGTKGVSVNGIVSGKMENHTTEVAVSGVGVLVTTTELTKQENKGIGITVGGTTINTEGDLEINASDTLSLENHLTQVAWGATDFGAIVSTTQDNSDNKLKLNAGNNFTAKNITVQANSIPRLSMDNTNVSVSGVRGAGMINEVSTKGNTELIVAASSTMKADKIDLKAQLLADDAAKYILKSDIHAVGVSALGIGVDKSRTYSIRNVKTIVGSITLSAFTAGTNMSAVNIASFDGTIIDNYIRTTSVGIIESESNFGQSKLLNNVTTSVDTGTGTWNAIDNLQVTATGNTKVKVHAKGTSGSAFGFMPYAAQVENKIDNDAILTIRGNYEVGSAKLYAEQANEMQLCADSLTVTVAGGSGTRTYNNVTFDTTANITGAKITATDGDVRVYANTLANMNKLDEVDPSKKFEDKNANCLVLGNGLGSFDIEVAKGENTITFNDTLNITNSTITSPGDIVLTASSEGILRSQLFDYTVNSVGGAQLRLYNTINSTNTINYSGSTIEGTKAEQDITLAAYDKLEITAATYTEMSAGTTGATEAKTTSTVDRKNILNLTSGEIHSLRDINLYSGKNETGNNSMFDFIGRAETYCGALVPFSTNPTLESTLKQNNEINVESGMKVISVRHSNLYADHGTEHIKLLEARHSMYRDKTNKNVYVATEKGNLADSGEEYKNYVKVDGSITAGVTDIITITIGTMGMFIVKDVNEKNMITAGGSSYNVYTFEEFKNLATGGLDIVADESAGLTTDKFEFGVDDFISNLSKREDELKKLKSDAELDGDKTLYNAYAAELERVVNLKFKMENMVEGQARQIYDAYIVVPDLVASGGNVNVDTGTLYGAGTDSKITAKGSPKITITNNTNLELRLNNITIDEPGGLFNFNNKAISGTSAAICETIKSMNKDKSADKSVGMNVTVPSGAGSVNAIDIKGNWAGNVVNYGASSYDDPEKGHVIIEPGSLYALANIEVNGNLYNKQGEVNIYSAYNDIIVEGLTAKDSVNIRGKEVKLSAPHGSITQGFTKGIVDIGGSVQSQFADLYKKYVEKNKDKESSTTNYSYSDGDVIPRNKGRIDGGEIYINALDININGILQSGYERFFVTIDETAQAKIDDLKNNNNNSDLSDLAVLGNPKYCVVEGKDVAHGNAGYYDRQIAVYYNPATDTLLTENVDASGGKIYLSGQISSTGSVLSGTGSGAIYCMDGAYNIDVTNKLPYDLKTNSLIVNDVSGLVQFTNLETGYKTLIRKNGITYQDSNGESVTAEQAGTQVFAQNGGYYFKPTENLRYTWSSGYSLTSYQDYYKEFMAEWWGLADKQQVDNETLSEWSDNPQGLPVIGASEERPNGETIGVGAGSAQVTIKHNKTVVSETNRLTDTRRWTTGYLGCHKRWSYTWRKTTGTVQSDVISVKADNNIGINFIGTSAENSVVKVQSTNSGNIILAGSTGNMLKYTVSGREYIAEKGKVIVDAQKSSVIQNGGGIYGAAVELSAAKDINITSIVNGHDLTLSANVTQGGSIDIIAKDRIGASVGADISNIKVGKLGGTNADILNLRTEGNIVQQANAPAATADRINFTSTYGGVYGENNSYFRLQGGQQIIGGDSLSASVNVTADKDIRVQQTSGDLRIGKFHTDNGDIYISVPQGGVVDALPYAERTPMEENELVDLWKSLGMIEGGDSDLIAEKNKALANTTGTIYENYCAGVKTAFERFTTISAIPEAERTDLQKEELVIYQKQFKTPESTDASPEYFASADAYLAQDAQAAKLAEIGQTRQETYKVWDKDLLLYQIDDAIVNPGSGVKTSAKEPNIFGKNINITVQNGVGLNSDKITEINMEHLDKNSVKFLSKVDPSTVTWRTNESNESIAVITDRLAIGVQQSGIGSINITTAGNSKSNVFLENRLDDDTAGSSYKNLDIAKISAGSGNVTLTSLGSIYDVNTLTGSNANGYATAATISGNNVILMTGAEGTYDGTIGKADKYVRLDMSGNLTATATGNIYLEQAEVNGSAKDLNILTMAAGVAGQAYSTTSGNIYLKAAGNIYSVVQDSRVQGYFHSDSHGQIIFDAGGNIGYAEKADGSIDFTKTIRFKNSAVEAIAGDAHDTIKLYSATGSINVEGVSTADIDNDKKQDAGGYFNLTELSAAAENTIITVNGKFKLNGDVTVGKTFMLNINTDADVDNNITARDIFISATKNIRLADNITLTAKTVTLTTGKAPELSYGTIAGYSGEGGTIRQGTLTDFTNVSGKMDFASGGNAENVFNSTSKIIANELKATASKGIYLAGRNDCDNVILHNYQENVVYHNVADVDPNETGDVLTVGIGDYKESTEEVTHILGTVWVYNEAAENTHDAKPMAVTSGVYAVNSIDLKSNGDLVNQYKIDSKQGSVYLEAGLDNGSSVKEGNLENYGSISAGSNASAVSKVEICATGDLHNHGEELNDLDVCIIGEDGVKISALKEVTNEAKLYALTGDVTIESQYSMKNTGNIYTVNSGNVTIKSSGDGLTSSGNVFAGNGSVTLNAKKTIRNTGDMFVYGVGSKVVMESVTGDVVNTDDLFFNDSLFMSLTGLSAPVAESTIYAYGGIELLAAQGNLYNSKELISNGDIKLKAKGDIIIETDPGLDDAAYLDETSGTTRIKNIKTVGGSVTIEGRNVINNMTVESDKGITVKATADRDSGGVVVAGTGIIKVQGNSGHYKTNFGDIKLEADGYWENSAYEGNQKFSISNGGVNDLIANCGDIFLEGEYSVENVGDIIAKKGETPNRDESKGNAFLTSVQGNIYNYEYADEDELVFKEKELNGVVWTSNAVKDGVVKPRAIDVEGSITWRAIKVYNKAGQYSDENVIINVTEGGVNHNKIKAKGDIILNNVNNDFTFAGSLEAGGNIILKNTNGSLIFLNGASMYAGGEIGINAGYNVDSGIKIEAGQGVSVYAEYGHIKLENGISAGTKDGVTAENSLIRVYSQNDTAATGATSPNVEIGGTLYSANGSINISTNSGGIQAENMVAKDLAAIASLKGNVDIEGITKGQKVTFYTEDEAAELSFEKVQFGDEIIMAANSGPCGHAIDMSNVEALSENYKMGLYGAGGTTGKGKYILKYDKVDEQINIKSLNGDIINIVANEPVKIDNISVSKEANIYTMGIKTKIYGTMGPTDAASNEIYYAPGGAQSIYLHEVFFDDVHTGNPETRNPSKYPQVKKMMEDSSQFATHHGGGKGMSLHIVDSSLQYGTGIVLADTYGSNVMANRYSVTDTMILLENIKAQAQFDNYFNIGMNFFDRYNIIDIPTVTVNSTGLDAKGQESNGIVVVTAKEDEYEF